MNILIADAGTAPVLRLLDIGGKLNMYVFSKSSLTQEKMNSFFTGTKWNLAERYTDMTKTLFVSLFFSALLPTALFVSSAAFFVGYWVDKYCLLRQWETPPALDDSLATKSRGHIVFCLFAHLLITANYYAGWSFDHVCTGYVSDIPVYVYCDKKPGSFLFPKVHDWMDDAQTDMVYTYGFGAFITFIFLIVFYFGSSSYEFFTSLFKGGYDSVGDDSGIAFNTVDNIQAYIPQLRHPGLTLPLLACDISLFDTGCISWTGDYAAQNVFDDLVGSTPEERQRLFSVAKQYIKFDAPAAVSTGQVRLEVA